MMQGVQFFAHPFLYHKIQKEVQRGFRKCYPLHWLIQLIVIRRHSMEWFGLILASIGVLVSVGTIIYSLWHLLDILADYLDERDRVHRSQWDG